MHIVYSLEEPPQGFYSSLFLAGPTPRSKEVASWRPQCLDLLGRIGYQGVVFVPEMRPGTVDFPDEGYPDWEHRMLNMSDLILFWVLRDLATLPGFTTNVEFGLFARSGKILFGPQDGVKNGYLNFVASKWHIFSGYTLEILVVRALMELFENGVHGAWRVGGERAIPLFIWRHRAFQNWYQAQTSAGHRLDGAEVEWISKVRNKPEAVFAFAVRPNIFVASENRNKLNDPVVFRLDISSVVLYKKYPDPLDSEIVLVREFRSAASTADAFIWELPGGSSPFITDPLAVAIEETREEVGLIMERERLRHIASRQMAGTLSVHKSHTYAAELTDEELVWLKSQKGIPHGTDLLDDSTGERAYTEVVTLREIIEKNLVDWSNIGMILSVL